MVQVTGARIASRVKRQFGDESGVQVTDNDIMMWLNDAMTEAAVQNTSINLKRITLASIAGTSLYQITGFDTLLSAVHSISYRPSASQPYVNLVFLSHTAFNELFPEWKNTTDRGTPQFYMTESTGTFTVYPPPAVTDAQAFSILFNSFFTDYQDLEDPMEISPRYFQYLLEYCLMKAYEMDENWEAADRKASFIQSTLNSLSSDDVNKNASKYPVITSLPEDM